LYPKPRTSIPNKEHAIYPYLLKGVSVVRPNQVWVEMASKKQLS
jgi:putative transposase